MKSLLVKPTPLLAVCLIGIIYLLIQFFLSKSDYNIIAYLIIFIVFLVIGIVVDRLLISQISYIKLFIGEGIFLIVASLWYVYSTSYTEINVETSKPYFFVLYSEDGLKKKDIPSKGLFSKSILVKSDSNVYVHYDLYNKAQINPPQSWKYNFSSNAIDTTINSKKVVMQVYVYDNKIMDNEQKLMLQKELEKIKSTLNQ